MPNIDPTMNDYAAAERAWRDLWDSIDQSSRWNFGWKEDWMSPSGIPDGNPIFTAVSLREKKGIRVIQYPALLNDTGELDFWLDVFGGASTDPGVIQELVISCSLTVETAERARGLMWEWIRGPIEISAPSFFDSGRNMRLGDLLTCP